MSCLTTALFGTPRCGDPLIASGLSKEESQMKCINEAILSIREMFKMTKYRVRSDITHPLTELNYIFLFGIAVIGIMFIESFGMLDRNSIIMTVINFFYILYALVCITWSIKHTGFMLQKKMLPTELVPEGALTGMLCFREMLQEVVKWAFMLGAIYPKYVVGQGWEANVEQTDENLKWLVFYHWVIDIDIFEDKVYKLYENKKDLLYEPFVKFQYMCQEVIYDYITGAHREISSEYLGAHIAIMLGNRSGFQKTLTMYLTLALGSSSNSDKTSIKTTNELIKFLGLKRNDQKTDATCDDIVLCWSMVNPEIKERMFDSYEEAEAYIQKAGFNNEQTTAH